MAVKGLGVSLHQRRSIRTTTRRFAGARISDHTSVASKGVKTAELRNRLITPLPSTAVACRDEEVERATP